MKKSNLSKTNPPTNSGRNLRQQAEKHLSGRKEKTRSLPKTDAAAQRLIHELQVHQIELELQNEELVQSRVELEAAFQQYAELYDYAPAGYFTLMRDGTISKVNLAGAKLLGVERVKLIERRLGAFVAAQSLRTWNAFFAQVFAGGKKEACEIEFRIAGSVSLWAAIQASAVDEQRETCRLVVIDITERKQAEEKIHNLNAELEQRVVVPTAQLEATNKQLDAYSYSISHDLRAPLRTIDGFSLALLEDSGDKLDEQGKGYLRRIREGTQRMGALIDDVLRLSTITRMEMKVEEADLSKIALSIMDEMQKYSPERHVEVKIAPGFKDTVDPGLMRIALNNLLDNAWKFTGKQALAVIEFGSMKEGEKKVYFIRDNGAGFNMAFADKLFTPFQRLHSIEEYPGTGIGLATVQRIINRHGGRIWAEGKVGKGATFFFSL